MTKCDYCGKENDKSAMYCASCGTPLRHEPPVIDSPKKPDTSSHARGRSMMLRGGIICLIGLVITVGGLVMTSGGGTYVVAWGAILFGALRFFWGVSLVNGNDEKIDPNEVAYAALSQATQLETQRKLPEAAGIYQKIADRFPDSDAGNDARKSLEILRANLKAD
jgi:hypothetical protein